MYNITLSLLWVSEQQLIEAKCVVKHWNFIIYTLPLPLTVLFCANLSGNGFKILKIIITCTNSIFSVPFPHLHSIMYQSSVTIPWANCQRLPNLGPLGKFFWSNPKGWVSWGPFILINFTLSPFSRPQSLCHALNIYKLIGRT